MLFTLRISCWLTFSIPFLNLPTPAAVFNPRSRTFPGIFLCLTGMRIPASCASRSVFSCFCFFVVSMPLRIRSGTFPFAASFPPRWDILASRVKWRNRPGPSHEAWAEKRFDSRRSRCKSMSFWRFSASSSGASARASWGLFWRVAAFGSFDDYNELASGHIPSRICMMLRALPRWYWWTRWMKLLEELVPWEWDCLGCRTILRQSPRLDLPSAPPLQPDDAFSSCVSALVCSMFHTALRSDDGEQRGGPLSWQKVLSKRGQDSR